jgi:16S rRNA (uracil1498-N3)-methyltransferase
VHLAAATIKRTERWRRIARQAAEQSRRAAPPEIAAPVELPEALGLPGDVRIVLAESEAKALLRDVLESLPQEAEIVLAVGPEGGWTMDELQSFHQAGWAAASLGKTVLRAETAAIAATAIAASELS